LNRVDKLVCLQAMQTAGVKARAAMDEEEFGATVVAVWTDDDTLVVVAVSDSAVKLDAYLSGALHLALAERAPKDSPPVGDAESPQPTGVCPDVPPIDPKRNS